MTSSKKSSGGFSLVDTMLVVFGVVAALVVSAYFLKVPFGMSEERAQDEMFVLIDLNKIVNSQRKEALKYFVEDTPWKITKASEGLDEDIRTSIRKHAGNAHVLRIETVLLVEDYRDITDLVLEDVGLPTDVPDVDFTNLGQEPTSASKSTPEESVEKPEQDYREMLP